MTDDILEITNLIVSVERSRQEPLRLIHQIDLSIPKGKVVGIVGESGSGKSISMKAVMNLLPSSFQVQVDSYTFAGKKETIATQGLPMAMIFQDPMTALNPLRTIGYHLMEVITRFQKVKGQAAKKIALAELARVGIPLPEKRFKQYPHQLSGGMRQRVIIAMAFLVNPQLLIADEPTTALDVTIQAQILRLIRQLQRETHLSVILVTHDFGVVAGMSDFIKVMYQGQIVEEGTTEEIFYQPQHPYTQHLLQASNLDEKPGKLQPFRTNVETVPQQLGKISLTKTHHIWLAGDQNQ